MRIVYTRLVARWVDHHRALTNKSVIRVGACLDAFRSTVKVIESDWVCPEINEWGKESDPSVVKGPGS